MAARQWRHGMGGDYHSGRTLFPRSDAMTSSSEPYDPNKLGWGFAAAIIVLAIVANVTAYSIHKATYLKPDKPAAAQAAH